VEFPTDDWPADDGPFFAGRLLEITEGKRLTLGPQNVLTQSERCAKGVRNSPFNFRGFRVPFLYSTNGEVSWFHDVRVYVSDGDVGRFAANLLAKIHNGFTATMQLLRPPAFQRQN
jgi:type I site-specific restriction endonuclease